MYPDEFLYAHAARNRKHAQRHATPATASRGGSLCIHKFDIGYLPFLNQLKDTLKDCILIKIDGDLKEFKNTAENELLQAIKTQIELCYDSDWFRETMKDM